MRSRYIRTVYESGLEPVNQLAGEKIIRSCFAFCPHWMQTRLERFFVSPQLSIEFEFEQPAHTVRIEKMNET